MDSPMRDPPDSYKPKYPEKLKQLPYGTEKHFISSYQRSKQVLVDGYVRMIIDSDQYAPNAIGMIIASYFNLHFMKFHCRILADDSSESPSNLLQNDKLRYGKIVHSGYLIKRSNGKKMEKEIRSAVGGYGIEILRDASPW